MNTAAIQTALNLDRVAQLVAKSSFPGMSAQLMNSTVFPTMSSLVYRMRFKVGGRVETLFVKLPTDRRDNASQVERLRREFAVTTRIRALLTDSDGLSMVSPVGYIDEADALLTREAPGQPLLQMINAQLRFGRRARLPSLIEYTRMAGQWLHRFHSLDLNESSTEVFTQLRRYCKYRLDTLVEHPASQLSAADAASLLKHIDAWIADVIASGEGIHLCHNDYSPHNIMAGEDGIQVLDFSFATPALPVFDQLCYWHKLEELRSSPFYSDAAIDALQRAFNAGYGEPIDFASSAVKLGLARLVLSKLLSTLQAPSQRPDRWLENRLRCQTYLAQIRNLFDPTPTTRTEKIAPIAKGPSEPRDRPKMTGSRSPVERHRLRHANKTICYFVGTHGDWGGASRILFNLVRMLDRDRFKPLVMLTRHGPICAELDSRSIDYRIWANHDYSNPLRFSADVLACMRFFRNAGVDLIHLNHACIGWRPAELIAARIARIPVVMHCQFMVDKPSPDLLSTTLVLTCSDYLAHELNTGKVPKRTVYDTVDLKRFGHGTDLRSEFGLAADDVIVSFVGRTRRTKGLQMFIDLARSLPQPNLRFLVTGQRVGRPTPDSYTAAEIEAFVAQDPRIRYLGFREDIENIYATTDIIVMPSQAPEACPAVLIESAVSGKPVIATRTGSTPEFITNGENGFLVECDDLAAMAACANQLISDAALRHTMGTRAREIAMQRFAHQPIEQIQDIYTELIGAD